VLLGLVALGESLIGSLEVLGVVDHLLNVSRVKTTDRVRDGDVSGLAGGLLNGGDLEDTVGIDLEDSLKDGLTSLQGRDTVKVELTEKSVLSTVDTLTLVDGELDGGLVVSNSGESSSLKSRNSGVTGNNGGENVTLHGNTKGKGNNIEEEEVLGLLRGGLVGQKSTLDGSTVSNSLIGVDGLLELLTVKEVGKELLDLGDTGGTTNKDNLVDLRLVDLGVLENLLNRSKSGLEESRVDLLETSTGDVDGKVLTLGKRVNLGSGLGDGRKRSLSTLSSGSESSESTGIVRDINTGLLLEVGLEELKQVGVEILTTQMGVTSSGLNVEDTTLDREEGDIESTTTKIENENVLLILGLTGTKTVSNSSGSGLVDDTEDVKTRNGTSVLGSLTLSVVEVGGDSDDSLLDLLANLGLSNLLHLGKNHGRDLLGGESLGLVEVRDLNEGGTVGVDDLEGPSLDVLLDRLVVETSTDQTLSVENGVLGVEGSLVLSGITDQSLLVRESNERGSNTVTLLVGNNLNGAIVSSNTRVGSTQIDTNGTRESSVTSCRHFCKYLMRSGDKG